jgi:hypothetical protein
MNITAITKPQGLSIAVKAAITDLWRAAFVSPRQRERHEAAPAPQEPAPAALPDGPALAAVAIRMLDAAIAPGQRCERDARLLLALRHCRERHRARLAATATRETDRC